MPFGAELTAQGVRFSIWAPAASRVDLELGPRSPQQMERRDDGFHVVTVPDASAGERYRYAIDALRVPDPASRFNPDGAEGQSEIIDPAAFEWEDEHWRGRPWRDTVLYELHVGAFTAEGTLAAAAEKLPQLAEIGITAVELMPIADGPGDRNWGYDGVLLYALRRAYGRPEDLKAFVQAAHRAGLMVFLDVVYNHFGPAGNYLGHYAPQFFTSRHKTPWGDAINFDGPDAEAVRSFFVHNALFWLEEYRFDGLRLDAVHAIIDDSEPDFLTELAAVVRRKFTDRRVHLVLENGDNEARYLTRAPAARPGRYTAQWNDDFHHVMHVLLTGETKGYYMDYDEPGERLLRALTEGFVYQGEPSRYAGGEPRGEPSSHLPPDAFVNFLQNHDQVGNRAFGERLSMLAGPRPLRAAETLLLLLPTPILLFMGEEFHAPNPFLYFCDYHGELADAVREGRRNEFAQFFDSIDLASIPDPNDPATLDAARLDWRAAEQGEHAAAMTRYTRLLGLRRDVLMPLLPAARAQGRMLAARALEVVWPLSEGAKLSLVTNLTDEPVAVPAWPQGDLLAASEPLSSPPPQQLPDWFTAWFLERSTSASAPRDDDRTSAHRQAEARSGQ